jgi:hypothetical protein
MKEVQAKFSKFDTQVGIGLMIFQQLGGINALGFYTSYIFSSTGN